MEKKPNVFFDKSVKININNNNNSNSFYKFDIIWQGFILFFLTDAPDNTTVSADVVHVEENTIPGRVICKSKANPGKLLCLWCSLCVCVRVKQLDINI